MADYEKWGVDDERPCSECPHPEYCRESGGVCLVAVLAGEAELARGEFVTQEELEAELVKDEAAGTSQRPSS